MANNKNEKEKFYGIRLNEDIPKLDKINKYRNKVQLRFMGKAFLLNKKDDKVERVLLENYSYLEYEGDYEIEFINEKKEVFTIKIRIERAFLFLILGLLVLLACLKPISDSDILQRYFGVIDFSVLSVDMNKEEKNTYVFDVDFKNIDSTSEDINLLNTVKAESVAKNKIAPGVQGEFSIIISTKNSTVDMKYSVNFENVTNDKPSNLFFKVKGEEKAYRSLQELEKELIGQAKRHSKKEIVIEWYWPYEIEADKANQDIIDTSNGQKLESYKFKINVKGEEVIR